MARILTLITALTLTLIIDVYIGIYLSCYLSRTIQNVSLYIYQLNPCTFCLVSAASTKRKPISLLLFVLFPSKPISASLPSPACTPVNTQPRLLLCTSEASPAPHPPLSAPTTSAQAATGSHQPRPQPRPPSSAPPLSSLPLSDHASLDNHRLPCSPPSAVSPNLPDHNSFAGAQLRPTSEPTTPPFDPATLTPSILSSSPTTSQPVTTAAPSSSSWPTKPPPPASLSSAQICLPSAVTPRPPPAQPTAADSPPPTASLAAPPLSSFPTTSHGLILLHSTSPARPPASHPAQRRQLLQQPNLRLLPVDEPLTHDELLSRPRSDLPAWTRLPVHASRTASIRSTQP